jgi:hypothetical protein
MIQDSFAKDQRAMGGEVAKALAVDIIKSDVENKSPRAEDAQLKHSGLLKVLGPKKYGGGEQSWEVVYKVIREMVSNVAELK